MTPDKIISSEDHHRGLTILVPCLRAVATYGTPERRALPSWPDKDIDGCVLRVGTCVIDNRLEPLRVAHRTSHVADHLLTHMNEKHHVHHTHRITILRAASTKFEPQIAFFLKTQDMMSLYEAKYMHPVTWGCQTSFSRPPSTHSSSPALQPIVLFTISHFRRMKLYFLPHTVLLDNNAMTCFRSYVKACSDL